MQVINIEWFIIQKIFMQKKIMQYPPCASLVLRVTGLEVNRKIGPLTKRLPFTQGNNWETWKQKKSGCEREGLREADVDGVDRRSTEELWWNPVAVFNLLGPPKQSHNLDGLHNRTDLSPSSVLCRAQLLSRVRLSVTPGARQAPLSMGCSRQEYWSGLPCPPPGDLPNPGIEPMSPTWQADSLLSELAGKPSQFARAAIAKSRKLDGLCNENELSHSSRCCKSEIKILVGLVPSECSEV